MLPSAFARVKNPSHHRNDILVEIEQFLNFGINIKSLRNFFIKKWNKLLFLTALPHFISIFLGNENGKYLKHLQ
jgi:hypothetical protein